MVLSLACGGVAAVIPGFLAVSMDKAGIAIRAGGALAVFLLVYFFNPAQLVASPSSIDVSAIISTLEARHADQLAASKERELSYQDQLRDLTEAVAALAKKSRQRNAPPDVEKALAQLEQGKTETAEKVFQTILDQALVS
jgi:hypothetical protein